MSGITAQDHSGRDIVRVRRFFARKTAFSERSSMNEHFTHRARKAIQLANQEAHRFNHEAITTVHVLLGLLKEGNGVAAHVLSRHNIDLDKIRRAVKKRLPSGPDMVTVGKLPLTPRARKAIDAAPKPGSGRAPKDVSVDERIPLIFIRETRVRRAAPPPAGPARDRQ